MDGEAKKLCSWSVFPRLNDVVDSASSLDGAAGGLSPMVRLQRTTGLMNLLRHALW